MGTANTKTTGQGRAAGWAGWLLGRLRGETQSRPSLVLMERITLGPKQSLALVEAEGRRILISTSAEGAPVFYPLDERSGGPGRSAARFSGRSRASLRASW